MPRTRSRAVIVHSLAHARAALAAAAAAGRPVVLMSAPGAAAYLGAGYFRAMIDQARKDHPDADALAVLDCGGRAGDALAALREGVEAVRYGGRRDVAAKIAAIARHSGGRLYMERPSALDLLDEADPETACRDWLGGDNNLPRSRRSRG